MKSVNFRAHWLCAMLVPLLAACAATPPPAGPPPAPRPGTTVRPQPPSIPAPPPVAGFRAPEILRAPGLEQVIQQNAASLQRTFGTPRLDVLEGDMRKLQFSGSACVLDIYLYPLSPGGEPVATHAEARRASDGSEVDRASCVRALSR